MTNTHFKLTRLGSGAALTLAALFALSLPQQAAALDKIKVAVGQQGLWSTAAVELGKNAGIFEKHGLEPEILYTSGGGETMQPVISGAVDVGVGLGTTAVIGAFEKGAPIRAIGAAFTGAETIWYVPASSPIRTLQDINNKQTVGYSSTGSGTHLYALAMLKQFKLKGEAVATGNPVATLTQTMSKQIDVGWTAPPVGLKEEAEGQIRIIGRGTDLDVYNNQTVRVLGASAAVLERKRALLARFMDAYRETINWMYTGDEPIKAYAKLSGLPLAIAQRTRDEFTPKAMMDPDRFEGLQSMVEDGMAFKFIQAPLKDEQVKTLFQIPFRP
jgi:NitT/TauT family transport system substrate-binding protein